MEPMKILLLEDNRTDAEIIRRLLENEIPPVIVRLATNKRGFLLALDEFEADVILSDNSLPGFDATEALSIVRQQLPHLPFILVTGTVSEEFAAGIIKQGADDYILKDRLTRLPVAIKTALKKRTDEEARKEMQEKLKEREQQFELFIRHSPAAQAMFDKAMNYIAVSHRWCDVYELTEKELIGKNHYAVFPEIPQRWKDIHAKCLKGATERNEEDLLVRSDGSDMWLHWEIHPWYRATGEIGGIIIFTEDITHRKKAEEEIFRTQYRLQRAQEIAHLGNWEVSFKDHKSIWSDEAYRIYGLEPGNHNFTSEDWLKFVHPDDVGQVKQRMKELALHHGDFSFDHRIIRPDGTIRYVHSESKYEFGDDGHPIGFYGIVHDVTERKLVEEELKKSNERFKLAAKATLDIIWELNFETKQYFVHEGGEKLFGDRTELDWQVGVEGKYVIDDDRDMVRDDFRLAKMNPSCELWVKEYRMLSTEGNLIHVVNHAIFIRDKEGKAIRAIGAIADISDKKKLQDELIEKEKQEQVTIIAKTLEAQEKERAAIGQELHDNVNQILVGTSLLLSTVKGKPGENVNTIQLCIGNLKDAIRENRKIAHELVGPDLDSVSLVDQLKNLTVGMFNVLGIEATINSGHFEEHHLDHAQKLVIYRIVQEQCTNIVKYAEATRVVISLVTAGNNLYVSIVDNGKGMDPNQKSSGIGLRNIKGRLSTFGGTANVISSPGNGFTLEITIPYGS
jgi:PAS domain S-box-containing protein